MACLLRFVAQHDVVAGNGDDTMRTHLTVFTAAILGAGGIGFMTTARADDPVADRPANQPPAQLEVELANRPASPAADDIRKTIAEATSAAVQGKFEDAEKRFSSADRKRLGDKFNNSSTLRDHFSQFEKDWKARYD